MGYVRGLKLYLFDGKANEELIEFLSKEFGVPKRNIEITKGAIGRNKTVTIKQIEFIEKNKTKDRLYKCD